MSARSLTTLSRCPESECSCQIPSDLDIDRDGHLDGSMPFYNQHVLISTGTTDWPSRVEDGLPIARALKDRLGPKGRFYNEHFKNSVLASSFSSKDPDNVSILLLPQFSMVHDIPSDEGAERFSDAVDSLCQDHLVPGDASTGQPLDEIESALFLICSHNARDSRCGLIGPLLEQELKLRLTSADDLLLVEDPIKKKPATVPGHRKSLAIGHISHIGGHKWAGNVIIYIPPSWEAHPLAGMGVWYGRVEPKHIKGILQHTIRDGEILEDIVRGVVDSASVDGKILARPLPAFNSPVRKRNAKMT